MDTRIIKAQIAFSANESVDSAEKKIEPVLTWLHNQPWVKMSSVAFGGEAGVLSLGSGNLPSEATITINAVNRFKRKKSIWELEDIIREKLSHLKGVKRNDVFDFGATALSSIKATVDTRLSSPYIDGLSEKSHQVQKAMEEVAGLTSVSTSWDKDFTEIELDIDKNKALSYGLTPYQIAMQIPLKGQIIGLGADLESMNTQFVRLYLKGKFSKNIETLKLLPISSKFGEIPLSSIAKLKRHLTFAKIERDKLLYSLDINGYRAKRPVTHLTDDTLKALNDANISGIQMEQSGDIAQI